MSTLSVSLRPRSFDEVIGQSVVVEAIQAQLKSGRLPRAWLFSGSTGVGKTTLAYILARELGSGETREINGADLGVDEARDLVEESKFNPLSGRCKAFIINEMQKSTDAAQQNLLVPLEQESSTVWIFTTTDPSKIIKPLRDRCLHHKLEELYGLDVEKLVRRACPGSDQVLINTLIKSEVRSPRAILMAVERYLGGLPASEAVQNPDEEKTEYIEIARAVVKGNWKVVAGLLKPVKASEALAIRAVVSNYFKSMLLSTPPDIDKISDCLLGLFKYNQGFQDGTTWPATVDWLLRCCRRMGS